jgi:hypothetical protein
MSWSNWNDNMLDDMGIDPDDYAMPEADELSDAEKNATPEELAAWEAKLYAAEREEFDRVCAEPNAYADIEAEERAYADAHCSRCGYPWAGCDCDFSDESEAQS